MTLLRTYAPKDSALLAWVDDVRRVLTAAITGLRWRDNIGPVREFVYLAAKAPIEVRADVRTAPLAVVVLRAENRTDLTVESGCRVTWTMRRDHLRIHSIDVSDTADEYDVTLGLLMG